MMKDDEEMSKMRCRIDVTLEWGGRTDGMVAARPRRKRKAEDEDEDEKVDRGHENTVMNGI